MIVQITKPHPSLVAIFVLIVIGTVAVVYNSYAIPPTVASPSSNTITQSNNADTHPPIPNKNDIIQPTLSTYFGLRQRSLAAAPRPKNSNNIDLDHFNESFPQLHEQWCNYVSSTAEPSAVLYPRMPKCGSSTIDELFLELSTKNNFRFVKTPRKDWVDLEHDRNARKEVLGFMKTNPFFGLGHSSVVIEGHFEKVIFKPEEFRSSFESIQLIRDCEGRLRSLFFYLLFQQKDATLAERAGKLNEFIANQLHYPAATHNKTKPFHFTDCMNDVDCLRRFKFTDELHIHDGVKHICDTTCIQQTGDVVKGAIYNAVHGEHFAVIGSLNHLEEYLEQLECVYPTLFKGIVKKYQNTQLHANTLKNTHKNYTAAFNQVVSEACDANTSPYGRIYSALLPFFRSRYQYMAANREKCCRKPRK